MNNPRATYTAVLSRIIPGLRVLDKLPFWIAVPVGLAIGGIFGYQAALSPMNSLDMLLLLAVLAMTLWFGLSAPRPLSTRTDSAGATVDAAIRPKPSDPS